VALTSTGSKPGSTAFMHMPGGLPLSLAIASSQLRGRGELPTTAWPIQQPPHTVLARERPTQIPWTRGRGGEHSLSQLGRVESQASSSSRQTGLLELRSPRTRHITWQTLDDARLHGGSLDGQTDWNTKVSSRCSFFGGEPDLPSSPSLVARSPATKHRLLEIPTEPCRRLLRRCKPPGRAAEWPGSGAQ